MRTTSHFLVFFMVLSAFQLSGQIDHLKFRFSNINFDRSKSSMTADIEMWTVESDLSVYAMNARFFYETEYLEFQSFSDFREGYDFVSGSPIPIIGGEKSAFKMFNSIGKAGYINAGIELKDPTSLDAAQAKEWSKLVQVNFKIKKEVLAMSSFCPALIWDIKNTNDKKQSFLSGSVGAVASVLSKGVNGAVECKNGECSFENLNWKLESDKAPFGTTFSSECLQNTLQLAKNLELLDYQVYQNTPNPFTKKTTIGFQLPMDQDVQINVFDLKGQLLIENNESFSKGENEYVLDASVLPDGTYMYQLAVGGFTSDYFRMIKIGN